MIITRAACVVREGMLEEATSAAKELRGQTLGRKGALVYELFLDADHGAIVSAEAYATSEDMLIHISTENFDRFVAAVTLESIELYGDPSSELAAAMKEFPVRFYPSI
jgi:quinol monooxygenase YgiN